MRVRDAESRVPAPRPSRRVRREASRALRGVRARRDQRPEPREDKARAPLSCRRLPAPCPAPLPGPASQAHGLLPGDGTGSQRAACAALSGRGFALAVPTSSRRLGPAGSRRGLLTAWLLASLRFSLALRPPLFFPGHFPPPSLPSPPSLPARVRVPGSAWLPR